MTPLQSKRIAARAREAHREGRWDEACHLYRRRLEATPRDRELRRGLDLATNRRPLREHAGFHALGLAALLPLFSAVAPHLPEQAFEAFIVIPLALVAGMLFVYAWVIAFKALFQQHGRANRIAAAAALIVVPATVAGIMLLENRRIDELNDRNADTSTAAPASIVSSSTFVDAPARNRVDEARRLDDQVAALKAALPGAGAGDPWLQFVVADIYMHGRGEVEADPERAFEWMGKAAVSGEKDAMYNVAYMLEEGFGVPRDDQTAFNLYYDLALGGHLLAQNSLGLAYLRGEGTAVDPGEAFYWFTRSADAGCAACMANLGRAYEQGHGIEVDLEQALHWYRKAVELDYAPAREWLTRLE